MADKQKKDSIRIFYYLSSILIVPALVGAVSFYWKYDLSQVISNIVLAAIFMSLIVYLLIHARLHALYAYDNERKFSRFVIWFYVSFLTSLLCHYLPFAGWPYLVIFIGLAISSNTIIGICCGTMFLSLSVLLTPECGFYVFFLYFIAGIMGIIMFSEMDEQFNLTYPLVVTLCFFSVLFMATLVIFENRSLSVDLLFVPVINLLISFLLLLLILKSFRANFVVPFRNRYLDINDQQYPLLLELKQQSLDDYMITIHTVHFSELIGSKIHCDLDKLKTCAYYYRIGLLKGENNWENVESICQEHHFPPEAIELLKECLTSKHCIRTREAAIVLISDSIIRVLLSVLKNNSGSKPDYQRIINLVFDKKMESGFLNHCNISIEEYLILKNTFLEENLYYDFLL